MQDMKGEFNNDIEIWKQNQTWNSRNEKFCKSNKKFSWKPLQ
jgi:hypothetical protein